MALAKEKPRSPESPRKSRLFSFAGAKTEVVSTLTSQYKHCHSDLVFSQEIGKPHSPMDEALEPGPVRRGCVWSRRSHDGKKTFPRRLQVSGTSSSPQGTWESFWTSCGQAYHPTKTLRCGLRHQLHRKEKRRGKPTSGMADNVDNVSIDSWDIEIEVDADDERCHERLPSSSQRLSWFTIMCLILNRSIGTGIFATPTKIIIGTGNVGPALVMWVCGGLVALSALHVWNELGLTIPRNRGRSVPRSGGEKNYVRGSRPAMLSSRADQASSLNTWSDRPASSSPVSTALSSSFWATCREMPFSLGSMSWRPLATKIPPKPKVL